MRREGIGGEEGGVMGWVRKEGRGIRGKGCLTV